MKYDHVVKFNGIYYAAGQEVPDVLPGQEAAGEETDLPFTDKDIPFETAESKYTHEDLENMTVKDIKRLAGDKGIEITKVTKGDVINEFLSKQ